MGLLGLIMACFVSCAGAEEGEQRGPSLKAKKAAQNPRFIERFDKDGDGALSEEERKAAREFLRKQHGGKFQPRENKPQLGGKKGKEPQFDRRKKFIQQFDKDGDGVLSEEEREAARAWMMKRRKDAEATKRKVALKFDTDGDGKISSDEWRAIQSKVKAHEKKAREELIAKYDADGDGKLSGKEKKQAHAAEKAAMLEKYDLDGDGELNLEEMKRAFDDMLENDPIRLLIQLRKQNLIHPKPAGRRSSEQPQSQQKKRFQSQSD